MQSYQDETVTHVFLTHLVGVFQNKTTQNTLLMFYRKFLRKKEHNYQMFCLNLWSFWNWVSRSESCKSLLPIFFIFHPTDFGGFLVCCYIAIQQLNGVEKSSVAITLMLSHNLTGLKLLYVISRAVRRVKCGTILKYHEWYSCQISRTNHAIICLYY